MKAICSLCQKPCECVLVDEGIGHYEFAGQPSNDVQLFVISDCCDEACLDEEYGEISAKEYKDFELLEKAELTYGDDYL